MLALCLAAYFGMRRAASHSGAESSLNGKLIRWTYHTSGSSISGIALGSDGKIYFAAQDGIYALSQDGKLLWKAPLVNGPVAAAPVVSPDGTIFVASSSGTIFQVDSTGKPSWTSTTQMRTIPSSPALSPDGMVFATDDFSDLFAFAPRLGSAASWTLKTVRVGEGADEKLLGYALGNAWEHASPAIGADGTIYLPHQQWLYRITARGEILWFVATSSGHLRSVALGPDGTAYVVGNTPNWLSAVDRDGKVKWQSRLNSAVWGSPAVDRDGSVCVCDSSIVTAIDSAGHQKWYLLSPCTSGSALAADGTIYLGALDRRGPGGTGGVIAVTPDGKLKWQLHANGVVSDAPAISKDGTIYFTAADARKKQSYVYAVVDKGAGPMDSSWPRFQHDAQNSGVLPVYTK